MTQTKTQEELEELLRAFVSVHIDEARSSGLDEMQILHVLQDICRSLEPTRRHMTPYPGLLNKISKK